MSKTITIDPVTRISGFLEIGLEVENNIIINAKTGGLLFRGFEKMLKGRFPLDAVYYTERICGICSSSHAIASSLALQNALKLNWSINDLYIRDLIHGFEFIQNHVRQFYFLTLPDYVRLPDINPLSPQKNADFRLPEKLNKKISNDYLAAVEISRLGHEGVAVLGAKAPHNHGIFVGGITVNIDSYKLSKVKSIILQVKNFVNNFMMEDINIISDYYPDYYEKGKSYSNYISYGLFNDYDDPEISYVKSGVMIDGKRNQLDTGKITKNVDFSWFTDAQPGSNMDNEVDLSKSNAYTFIKAPRYNGLPMEGGPLARMMITGEYTRGNSCMDRNVARVLEMKKIIAIMERLADRIEVKENNQKVYEIPDTASGTGLTDTIRGALGHFLKIENKVIKNYEIITPTMWNMSPLDNKGMHGPGEKSLIGTRILDLIDPTEPGRIIRSFDPCISCATHVINKV